MEKLILSILLLVSAILYAQEHDKPDTSENIDPEKSILLKNIKLYNNELTRFLSESNDIKIQLSAYNMSFGQGPNINEIKKVLKTAITPSSDKYTIFLANSLCHNNKELTDWCHQQHIHETHGDIDPENVYTYLYDLSENKDIETIQEILNEVSVKTTYSDSFFFEYIIQMAEQIVHFNNLNPLLFNESHSIGSPGSENYLNETQSAIDRLKLVEKGIVPNDFMLYFSESTSIIAAIGFEMAKGMAYTPITRACKEINNADSCLHIGKLLKNDKTLIGQMIGFAIVRLAQEQSGADEITIQENQMKIDKINKELSCYSIIEDVTYALMSNKKLITQYLIDAKNKGELEAMRQSTYSVYNTEKKNGFNPSFDPKDCQ